MFKPKVKVRTAYGKPWSKLIGEIGTSKEFLREVGKILVKQIIREGKNDIARQGGRTGRGEPEGLPLDQAFWDSFSYKISGKNQVDITSNWSGWAQYAGPNWRYSNRSISLIEQLRDGRRPYPMDWLTKEKGIGIVPLEGDDGKVLFRWAPSANDPWIHPGFRGHTFMDRAFKKAKKQISEKMAEKLKKALSKERRINLS